jgi:hypothetical protein
MIEITSILAGMVIEKEKRRKNEKVLVDSE